MQQQRTAIALIFVLLIGALVVLTQLSVPLGLDLRGGAQLTIQVQTTEEITDITQDRLESVKRVIQNRVDGLGVSEPIVQTVGGDRISVQLPGVSDPAQAERVLGGTAQLEFRAQKEGTDQEFQEKFLTRDQLEAQLEELRENSEENQAEIEETLEELDQVNQEILDLFEPAALTGSQLEQARAQPAQAGNNWQVQIRFDQEGGSKFAELTRNIAGTGRGLGIFLDDELVSAPTVSSQYADRGITGGSATISGGFTVQEAEDLAIQLRGGSLPLPVEIVENRTVGATLGQESIQRSIYASLSGLILVLVFMGVYYRLPGLIADLALSIYALLTFAAYVLVGVTLTLPGIAGFILSIGMAVDANVLIFERTREELRAGKTLYRAVEGGFYRAFSSILDSNVTTLIACAALFWLGSGLVRGFAVTLAIGVLISLFTALTCTRTFLLFAVLGFPTIRKKPELFCPNLAVQK
ncbi:protein translocase subunit SecD [Euhalothece natronophila Z-M001]|uniref:Protein translocase subunit SecD n=1 Tax=Euhalothece natronophila Z-M001 TaxID=522448 RepID=A0A5B8NK92_9CHRO|nr:protein translocase subunit SecD [Euhalothece natronophila]QDZ38780.1 protein translocase subunit SecD [Euhalothece natronophila Z-M001]